MGITGLPSFVAEDALLENALERVLPRWHLLSTTLYAGMPTRKHVPTRTRAFVDFLVADVRRRGSRPVADRSGLRDAGLEGGAAHTAGARARRARPRPERDRAARRRRRSAATLQRLRHSSFQSFSSARVAAGLGAPSSVCRPRWCTSPTSWPCGSFHSTIRLWSLQSCGLQVAASV